MTDNTNFDTQAVRAGSLRTEFQEHSEALFLTSSFIFDSAQQAASRFSGQEDGYVYSRFSNPTVQMFEQRLAALEGAQDGLATASGMAAIWACVLATLRAGDHLVYGANIFGATLQLFGNLLPRLGIECTAVDATDLNAWRQAIKPNTRLLFCETPSNPLMALVDLEAFAQLGRDSGALSVVDNCFCTPAAQKPLDFGVDVVVHSATKFIDGQGRVLGGAVLGERAFIREALLPVLRMTGPSLSPFNAWVLLKGLETLSLRLQAQSARAQVIAQWLQERKEVSRVYYPGLASHPQRALVQRQQSLPGAVIAFELSGDSEQSRRERAWRLIDRLKLMSITANLGDTRTTITHPASTTHGRLPPEARARAGIDEGLVRISVGLESETDLLNDLKQAIEA